MCGDSCEQCAIYELQYITSKSFLLAQSAVCILNAAIKSQETVQLKHKQSVRTGDNGQIEYGNSLIIIKCIKYMNRKMFILKDFNI